MKITKRQLKKLIAEGLGIDTGLKKRELGSSSFEKAQSDAKKNGKSYFINKRNDVIIFDKDGNATKKPDMTSNDAFEADDGTVHYIGAL